MDMSLRDCHSVFRQPCRKDTNELHWVLDVAFREDGLRTRMGNGPETGAILRHISVPPAGVRDATC